MADRNSDLARILLSGVKNENIPDIAAFVDGVSDQSQLGDVVRRMFAGLSSFVDTRCAATEAEVARVSAEVDWLMSNSSTFTQVSGVLTDALISIDKTVTNIFETQYFSRSPFPVKHSLQQDGIFIALSYDFPLNLKNTTMKCYLPTGPNQVPNMPVVTDDSAPFIQFMDFGIASAWFGMGSGFYQVQSTGIGIWNVRAKFSMLGSTYNPVTGVTQVLVVCSLSPLPPVGNDPNYVTDGMMGCLFNLITGKGLFFAQSPGTTSGLKRNLFNEMLKAGFGSSLPGGSTDQGGSPREGDTEEKKSTGGVATGSDNGVVDNVFALCKYITGVDPVQLQKDIQDKGSIVGKIGVAVNAIVPVAERFVNFLGTIFG